MKSFFSILFVCFGLSLSAQDANKPSYCDALPDMYEKGAASKVSLPRFSTTPVKQYKVQVAILRQTNPENYPFHRTLVARYRPCEQVWVIESKETFDTKEDANVLKRNLSKIGYEGAYITELVGFK